MTDKKEGPLDDAAANQEPLLAPKAMSDEGAPPPDLDKPVIPGNPKGSRYVEPPPPPPESTNAALWLFVVILGLGVVGFIILWLAK